ncbi:MAG: hypothetical protein J6T01_04870 [Kiritimatiellae bacterium]|nr:hypothetical protein [Kiritimatiellia bacterium]
MKPAFAKIGFAAMCLAAAGCSSVPKSGEFTYASWNIGHFAWGRSRASTIPPEQAGERGRAYRDFLDKVGAQVLGVCEFSEAFTTCGGISSEAAVFGRYSKCVKGPGHDYQWNAFCLNGFEIAETKIVEYPQHDQRVYYLAIKLKPSGAEPFWAVQTHLDWTTFKTGHEDDRKLQMKKLIDDFRNEPRVIISGDFNIGFWEEYDVFMKAGYKLVNGDATPTYPSNNPKSPLDNIMIKGMDFKDARFMPAGDLSDHDLVSCTVVY